ncbi:MAG TPA: hypothetical protein VN829_00340, partial [Dongiaceae bacterium]|nr:hypothetical protein [Dongiaceae bacterium]
MLSQNRPTIPWRVVIAIALMLVAMSGCRHTPPSSPPPSPPPPPLIKPSKVVISEHHDQEIKEIMELARLDRWEEAQNKANALWEKDRKNTIVM